MDSMRLQITLHPKLRCLLRPTLRELETIDHFVSHSPSVKDLIESLRVPHPAVGRIEVNNNQVDFGYRVRDFDRIHISPLKPPVDPCKSHILRPDPLPKIRFLVDVNVGKLCSLLRMAGFDTLYFPEKEDALLAEIAVREQCILLSRDIGLLKRKMIMHGHYVWNQEPGKQLAEVVELYNLESQLQPFSRCMRCNTELVSVAKKEIIELLEPLTKKYYDIFYRCPGCRQIYWSGSHKTSMITLLNSIIA